MIARRFIFVLCIALAPAAVSAQDCSHWGVVGSVTPQWQVPSQLAKVFDGTVDIKGSDFTIGIARGRDLGGDWGVSYVQKRFKDGSLVQKLDQKCFTNGCFPSGTTYSTTGVALSGVEVHKYVPFATIKQRVQIGMNFAGGIGQLKGNLQTQQQGVNVTFDQRTNTQTARPTETRSVQAAKQLTPISAVPLLNLQAAVGVIVAPGVKVRMAGGLDFPGYNMFSISAMYLFGAR